MAKFSIFCCCSSYSYLQVLMLFADNFDYQDLDAFVRGVLNADEVCSMAVQSNILFEMPV